MPVMRFLPLTAPASSGGPADPLAATLSGTASVSGLLTESQNWTASTAGTSSVLAAFGSAQPLTGSPSGTGSVTAGGLTETQNWTASAASTSSVTATRLAEGQGWSATAAGTSSLTAGLGEIEPLSSSPAGVGSLTAGGLTETQGWSATAAGTSSVIAGIAANASFSASPSGTSGLQASGLIETQPLTADATGTSGLQSLPTESQLLGGVLAGSAVVVLGALHEAQPLTASLAGGSSGTAGLGETVGFSASAAGLSSVSATALREAISLSASLAGLASSQGTVSSNAGIGGALLAGSSSLLASLQEAESFTAVLSGASGSAALLLSETQPLLLTISGQGGMVPSFLPPVVLAGVASGSSELVVAGLEESFSYTCSIASLSNLVAGLGSVTVFGPPPLPNLGRGSRLANATILPQIQNAWVRRHGDWSRVYRATACSCVTDGNPTQGNKGCKICFGRGYAYPFVPRWLRGVTTMVSTNLQLLDVGVALPGDLLFVPQTRGSSRTISDWDLVMLEGQAEGMPFQGEVVVRADRTYTVPADGVTQGARAALDRLEVQTQATTLVIGDMLSYQAGRLTLVIVMAPALGTYTTYQEGVDFTVYRNRQDPGNGSIMSWLAGHGPALGAQYAVSYLAHYAFIAFAPPTPRFERGTGLGERIILRKRHLVAWAPGVAGPVR